MRYLVLLAVYLFFIVGCASTAPEGPSTLNEWGKMQMPRL